MAVTYRRYYQEREDLLKVKVFDKVLLILPDEVSNRKGASVF